MRVGTDVTATFTEPVLAGSITVELRTPGGTLVPGTTTYDAATRTATLDPTSDADRQHDLHRDRQRRRATPRAT